ncbi:ABC transporter permease [Candidatus Magnetaquicoccus inordinatus]|uniref:ABC transporter permease n=1 Tax=Candidatus Magnetaquicoccus inordinatus TaxID=2496818 RepID=UPI00102C3347
MAALLPLAALSGWQVAAWVAALPVLLPLLIILSAWLQPEWAVWSHLADTVLMELLRNTLILVLGVSMGVLLLGISLAWLTTYCRFPGYSFFSWALILPMALPGYVLAFTTLGFLDYGGLLQQWLGRLFGANGYWFPNPRSSFMVVAIFSLTLYPYVYLLARSAFLSQGERLLEAARLLGRSPWGAFFHVALPIARPAIAAGTALAVMEALADFGTVSVFSFNTFTTAIYKAWFGLFNLPAATQLASLLLLFIFIALIVEQAMRGQARYVSAVGQQATKNRIMLNGWRGWAATIGAGSVFFLAFLLPLLQLLLWVSKRSSDLDSRYWALVVHTLLLGFLAAVLALAGALLLGVAKRRCGKGSVTVAVRVATIGYALPGSVLAVGVMLVVIGVERSLSLLLGFFAGAPSGNWLSGTILALLFAYVTRFLAVAYGPVASGLEAIRPSLVEAAYTLGSTHAEATRRIYLPMLRPSLLTALLLVLVEVMKEMPATLLLRPFGWDTLAVRIYEMTSEGEWERAALPAVMLVLAGLLPVILLVRRSSSLSEC